MGRVRRGGYLFLWWIGDHSPRHIHVFDKNGKAITRVNLDTMRAMDIPKANDKIIALIQELKNEGRL
jgi:hypothetical protein